MRHGFIIALLISSTLVKGQTIVSDNLSGNLYVGIDNPISLTNRQISDGKPVLFSDCGSVVKLGRTKYIWNICSTDKRIAYLKIYKRKKLVDSLPFKVVTLPDPTLSVRSQDGEYMFRESAGVRAEIIDFVVEGITCKVEKFVVTIEKNKGGTIQLINTGPFFQNTIRQAFQNLQVGDKVILSNFFVTVGCETRPRHLTQTLYSVYSGKKYEWRY